MWRLHLYIAGQRLTLRGFTRRTLLRQLRKLTYKTLTRAQLWQRACDGSWYRSSLRAWVHWWQMSPRAVSLVKG